MNLKNKKILVTGGTGFLGKNLVPVLAKKSKLVTVVSTERKNIFKGLSNVKIVAGNIENKNFCEKVLKNADVCFHLASFKMNFRYHTEHPLEVFSKNVLMGEVFLEAVGKSKIKNLIITSSVAVYGPKDSFILENDSLNLESKDAYALSKITLESNARVLSMARSDMSVAVARCDNFFGEFDNFGPDAQVIPSLIRKCVEDDEILVWGSGNQKRTFCYVSDICNGLVKLLDLKSGAHFYNISNGKAVNFKQVVSAMQKNLNQKKPVIYDRSKPEGAKTRIISSNKIKKELNWDPKFTLEEGLKKTVKYYLENKK